MAAVAERAGVSLKTVSRVINFEPAVHPATADRVNVAAFELGYRRNDVASSLARARPQAGIGLMIEDVSDPFYARLTRGVEEVAREHGHLVVLSSSQEDADLERTATMALASRGVDGMIMVPHSEDHRYLAPQINGGLVVVFVDRPPSRIRADYVLTDNIGGARSGVSHLIDLGHRRIAFVGNDPSVYTSTRRLRGYRKAHTQSGIPVDESLVVMGPRTQSEAIVAVGRLLAGDAAPTAIFTQNNLLTVGAWRAVRAAGAPVDLVGFDDFDLADVLDPPVTVVAQDAVGLGRRAARLLFARLAGDRSPARRVVVPTRLIVRGR